MSLLLTALSCEEPNETYQQLLRHVLVALHETRYVLCVLSHVPISAHERLRDVGQPLEDQFELALERLVQLATLRRGGIVDRLHEVFDFS